MHVQCYPETHEKLYIINSMYSTCDYKRAEGQNRLLTGAEKRASGVNSQAAARLRIVISRRVRLLVVPGVRLK